MFPTWTIGAELHIIDEAIRLDIVRLNDYFETNGVTITFLPTQLAEQFMELENTSLRVLLTGGDKLKRAVKKPYTLVNNYGPTEGSTLPFGRCSRPGRSAPSFTSLMKRFDSISSA
ncbi:AMP-binding protein [Bacillus subtilis]|uniref:AMP-binding protein n=1 Tax=Bacillus subtilis TaxID=1423 RepID=UPI003F742FA7